MTKDLVQPEVPQLSILIVNWNSKDYLLRCLDSIRRNTHLVRYEVIVVDSGSYDDSAELVARDFPEATFVQSAANVGFGRANNLAAQHAQAAHLLLLNPDTEIAPGAIDELYRIGTSLARLGIAGCRLLNTDGTLQTSCVMPLPTIWNQVFDADVLHRLFYGLPLWVNALSYERCASPASVEALSGACMLLERRLFLSLGGFSPEYFMYAEDLDLCLKSLRAGRQNYYIRSVEILHHGGGSSCHTRSSFANIMMRRSLNQLLCKLHGRGYAIAYRGVMGLAAVLRLLCLVTLTPSMLLRRFRSPIVLAGKKWLAILCWSVGLENWLQPFAHVEERS